MLIYIFRDLWLAPTYQCIKAGPKMIKKETENFKLKKKCIYGEKKNEKNHRKGIQFII